MEVLRIIVIIFRILVNNNSKLISATNTHARHYDDI